MHITKGKLTCYLQRMATQPTWHNHSLSLNTSLTIAKYNHQQLITCLKPNQYMLHTAVVLQVGGTLIHKFSG